MRSAFLLLPIALVGHLVAHPALARRGVPELSQSFQRRLEAAVAHSRPIEIERAASLLGVAGIGRILADGSSSDTGSIQIPGRATRINPATGKKCGIVVDCWDAFDDRFKQAAYSRRSMYGSRNWTQYLPNGAIWHPRYATQTAIARR